jgi:hypothetical protein
VPRDLISSLFWLAFSAFVCTEGVRLKLGEFQRPGPGFFPFWAGLVLGILSLIHLANAVRKKERILFSGGRWPALLLVSAAILVYFLCVEKVGFLIATFLLLFLLFRLERKRWILTTLWSIVATVASYAFFQLLLQTQLPAGWLGF